MANGKGKNEPVPGTNEISSAGARVDARGDPIAVEDGTLRVQLEAPRVGPLGPQFGAGQVETQTGFVPRFPSSTSINYLGIPAGPTYPAPTARYTFDRPTILYARYLRALSAAPAPVQFLALFATPDRPNEPPPFLGQPGTFGYGGTRGALFIPTPGVWWVGAFCDQTFRMEVAVLDGVDPFYRDILDREQSVGYETGANNIAVPNGADAEVIPADLVIRSSMVEVQNTGGAVVNVSWGQAAALTTGYPLQPLESRRWSGRDLPVAALHAFGVGAAGTLFVGCMFNGN